MKTIDGQTLLVCCNHSMEVFTMLYRVEVRRNKNYMLVCKVGTLVDAQHMAADFSRKENVLYRVRADAKYQWARVVLCIAHPTDARVVSP